LNESNFEDAVNSPSPVLIFVTVPDGPPQLLELETKLVKLVRENDGHLALGKMNAREQMAMARELGVSNVPTTLAVFEGKMVNSVVGVPTDQTLTKFVNDVIRVCFAKESQSIMEQADHFLQENNIPEAAKLYSQIVSSKKFKVEAIGLAGLAECALKEGNTAIASELTQQIKDHYSEFVSHPKVKQVISMVDLQSTPQSNANIEELLQKIKQNPKDLQSRFDLAMHYQSMKQWDNCTNELFNIVKMDKEWNNQMAKITLLKLFESLGPEHEVSVKGRKRLNNLWFL